MEQGELFPRDEEGKEKMVEERSQTEEGSSDVINPDSMWAKLTDEEIAALDEKDEYYKGQN